jgi:glycerate kinase
LLEGCTIVTSSTDPISRQVPSWRAAHGTGISQRLLIACVAFGPRLPAATAARALARGLTQGRLPEPDVCALAASRGGVGAGGNADDVAGSADGVAVGADLREMLEGLDFDARMRRARAIVVGAPLLAERALAGSVTFEIATRARQSGVPAYAVTRENALDAFDARILDLQLIVQARSATALVSAGLELARLV